MAPITLVPFLYHTRTLQMFARTRVPTPALRACFHTSPRQNLPRPHRQTAGRTAGRSAEPTAELVAERPTQPAREEPAKRVRRSPTYAKASYNSSVPFEGLEFEEEDDPEVLRQSTITIKERDAFDRIFEEIAMRGRAPANPAPIENRIPGSPGHFLPDLFPQQEQHDSNSSNQQSQSEGQSVRDHINVIIRDAETQASGKDKFHRHHMLGQVKNVSDPDRALMRFPPSLRKAAKLALGVMDRDRQTKNYNVISTSIPAHIPQTTQTQAEITALDEIADNKLSDKIAAESLRAVERKRVEAKMRAAKTDFQLWDVLEKEVFSMVEKLGIAGDSDGANTVGGAKKKRIMKQRNAVAAATDSSEASSAPDGKLSMNVYGPLYPSYLLLALRLMDQSFAHSSPMALNLLPRIKELGLMSFVLGVSSPFYNTLARILWYRYGDAKAVLDLLEEMRHVGLYCDGNTQGIIYRIQEYLKDSKSGMHGPFVSEIVDGFDYEVQLKTRLKHWNLFIGKQLEEKSADLVPSLN